jgi:hypothetical protein
MLPSPAPASRAFSRRALLAASAGLALATAGCTSDSPETPPVSAEQVDRLAGQVAVQQALVDAYAAAAADGALGGAVTALAQQAGEQLAALQDAAPSPSSASASASASSSAAAAPPAGGDVRGWLRDQVSAAAGAHAAACVEQTGARAALLGSIAAGLRGHEAALA